MATDRRATHSSPVFAGSLRASAVASPTEPAADRQPASLTASRTMFPANFFSHNPGGADFRDFRSPSTMDVSAAAKLSPNSRRCRSDECRDDFSSCLDLTGIDMRDVFKATPSAITSDHRQMTSPTSSTSSHRHLDQSPPHLQHQQLTRSELLQQQQQCHEDLFIQQARQWYLHQSPTTSTTSTPADPGVNDLVNGRSPGAAPQTVFRHHEAAGPLIDVGPQCHWPPAYTGLAPETPHQHNNPYQKELSPTQKIGNGGVPFYPWMAVVGQYTDRR